jgi:hypothetical protein
MAPDHGFVLPAVQIAPAPPAVVVGTIPALPPTETTLPADQDEGLYPHTLFDFQTLHYRCNGKLQLPVSGPDGTPSVIVRLSAPWGYRVVIWLAARNGRLPRLPDCETTDANEVLGDVEIGTVEPKVIDGVRYEYTVSGKYTYLLYRPPNKQAGFEMGSSVISTVRPDRNVIPAAAFTKDTRGK